MSAPVKFRERHRALLLLLTILACGGSPTAPARPAPYTLLIANRGSAPATWSVTGADAAGPIWTHERGLNPGGTWCVGSSNGMTTWGVTLNNSWSGSFPLNPAAPDISVDGSTDSAGFLRSFPASQPCTP